MDFSETIEVKAIDKEDKISENGTDSYFFAYFQNTSTALDQIRDAVKTYKPFAVHETDSLEVVHDTTGIKPISNAIVPERAVSEQSGRLGYGIKLVSLLRPFQSDTSSATVTPGSGSPDMTVLKNQGALVSSPSALSEGSYHLGVSSEESAGAVTDEQVAHRTRSEPTTIILGKNISHTYPPPPSPPAEVVPIPTRDSASSTSSWGVPNWLRTPRRVFASPSASTSGSTIGPAPREVSEFVSDVGSSSRSGGRHERHSSDLGFSVLETKDIAEPEQGDKFRATFAFDEKELLLGCEYILGFVNQCSVLMGPARLPRISFQATANIWSALHLYKLLLFQIKRTVGYANEDAAAYP